MKKVCSSPRSLEYSGAGGLIRSYKLLATVIVVSVFLPSTTGCSKPRSEKRVPSSEAADEDQERPSLSNPTDSNDPKQSEMIEQVGSNRELLRRLTSEWEAAEMELSGEELLHRQWEIERRAVALGPGDAFLDFLKFLSSKAANDIRMRVISEMGNAMFSGRDAIRARDWLTTVEDKELRVALCRLAGKHHPGDGLKEYIARFAPDDHSQSALLTAYCKKLALTDPSGAIRTFTDLRPPNVTFDGIVEVMSVLPPESNYAAISSVLPDDSKGVARRARTALLKSWVKASPDDAAQYVISNTSLVHPEQMATVVQAWCAISPDDAAAWIEGLSAGAIKDQGIVALARHWSATDPMKAWGFAARVGDFNKRVEAATEVFKEWEKTDREAATKAWVELFPGG